MVFLESKRAALWIHELMHRTAVYLFGAKTLFRYQCFCGASVLKPMPGEMRGGAFTRGGSFDITPTNGSVVAVDCIFCGKSYELVWSSAKEQFTIAKDWEGFLPDETRFKVVAKDGDIIANGVSMLTANKYQDAHEGSTIEKL